MDPDEWRFALTISGAHGMDHLLKRVFPPLVPIWAVVFGFPLWKLGLLLGARSFGSAVGQAPMGYLSDQYDRRLMLPAGIGLIGVCFLLFAWLPGLRILDRELALLGTTVTGQFVTLLVVMIGAGIGSSTLHPAGYPLISQNVSGERKGTVLGMWGSARSFGDGTAPALVGAALLVVGWRSIIAGFGLLGIGYAAYLLVVLGGFETRPDRSSADASSVEDPKPRGAERDRRQYAYPMVAVFAAFLLLIIATSGVNVFLTEFITSEYGYSFVVGGIQVTPESTASFYYSALLLTAGVVQLGTGRLVDSVDHRKVLITLAMIGGVGLLSLAMIPTSPIFLFVILLLLGASLWSLNPARDALVSDITPAEREGRTFGYLWTAVLLFSSVSPAVIGYIGDVASLREAFALLAGLVFCVCIPVGLLFSRQVYTPVSSSKPNPDD